MTRNILTVVMSLFFLGCGGGGGDDVGTPAPLKTCSDFPIQPRAQEYFEANGGSVDNNFDNLDPDRDGIACEELPPAQGAPELE